MIKTKVPEKDKASSLGIKQKLSPIPSLRSASTSLVNTEARIYHSFTTPSASPNGNNFSCLPETSQSALCLARQPMYSQLSLIFGDWQQQFSVYQKPQGSTNLYAGLLT